MINSRELL